MANDAYIPDERENEENAQINLEEYDAWIHSLNFIDELNKELNCETNSNRIS
jgi:hypothetical protein